MDPIRIKYRDVDANGNLKGFLVSRSGQLTQDELRLKDITIGAGRIVGAESRDKRLQIVFNDPASGGATAVVIEVYKPAVLKLERAINRIASDHRLLRRQQELAGQGRANEFRTAVCPNCDATLDLTGHTDTPELFCAYCGAVHNTGVAPKEQARVQVCDACGYYAFPRGITCFYFYFLIFFYGFHYRRKHMCSSCMRTEGWKMLAGNLIFVLGVPVALVQLSRAYFGGAAMSSAYRGIESANAAARKGKVERADAGYHKVVDRLGVSAIARFNEGLAHANANDLEGAARAWEDALVSCSNFAPAAQSLAVALHAQGRDPKQHPLLEPFIDDTPERAAPAQMTTPEAP